MVTLKSHDLEKVIWQRRTLNGRT